jgi:hypothetical protein
MINYISIEDIKKITNIDKPYVDILCDDIPVQIKFEKQKTGYGEKSFMICPRCYHKREKLYLINGTVVCRSCFPLNVYRGLQHTTKGGCDYITYKMHRFALTSEINFERHPFHYYDYEKPKYKHVDKWCDNLAIMQALANMRFQTIFLKKIWDIETINSVITRTNSLSYIYDLEEMDTLILNWDHGVNMNTTWK